MVLKNYGYTRFHIIVAYAPVSTASFQNSIVSSRIMAFFCIPSYKLVVFPSANAYKTGMVGFAMWLDFVVITTVKVKKWTMNDERERNGGCQTKFKNETFVRLNTGKCTHTLKIHNIPSSIIP